MSKNKIMNCETYLINLKKDYGRLLFSSDVIDIFDPKIFEGNDCNKLNEEGYLESVLDMTSYTKSAKITKKKLLEHFLMSSDKKYIMVFEDDIYLHIDLFDCSKRKKIFQKINDFINDVSPVLLYLGTSRHFTSENLYTSEIAFCSIYDKFKNAFDMCSGAYGFILRRDMIPTVLMRINNETIENMPFDLYCLSYLAKIYPKECFVTNPHLVLPNVESSNIRESYEQPLVYNLLKTKKELYNINKTIGIIFIENNMYNLDKTMTCLTPLVKICYDKKSDIDKYLDKYDFVIECKNVTRLKYFSGKIIIDTIKNNYNECKILNIHKDQIHNLDANDVLLKVTYSNQLKNEKNIVLNI